jgi:4a-hydroxytetrahydrobiopterin dehydratase
MNVQTEAELAKKKCVPCEGGVEAYSQEDARKQVASLPGWQLGPDGKKIRREWVVKDFMAGIKFFNEVARVAQAEDHHPDLHLAGYRKAAIELSTHAIGGLSENDFILAAKIDKLPVELKQK